MPLADYTDIELGDWVTPIAGTSVLPIGWHNTKDMGAATINIGHFALKKL